MKLPIFRKDAAAGLAKAQAALTAAEGRISELEIDRLTALRESDAIEPVAEIDRQIADLRKAAATHTDRVAVLKAALREQQAEETERQRQAAIAEIEKRLTGQVELAREVEQAVKNLGQKWNRLLQWRQAILGGWPDGLARPLASDFQDQRYLIRELAAALHGAGQPRWDKICSIPAPAGSIPVQGLETRGLANTVAAAGAGFISRIKSQRIATPDDDSEAAA
jgi:hypothetical protein